MFAETVGGLDEVFLQVKDLEAMRTYYKDVLGFEEDFYHEGGYSGLRTGGAALVLKASEKGSSGVMLVFACTDIDLSLQAATEQGATITHPVTDGHWGAKIAGFEDPEGNSLFLEQPTESKEHSLTE